eukprot:1024527-Prorocentrum_minimum.AAC.1
MAAYLSGTMGARRLRGGGVHESHEARARSRRRRHPQRLRHRPDDDQDSEENDPALAGGGQCRHDGQLGSLGNPATMR